MAKSGFLLTLLTIVALHQQFSTGVVAGRTFTFINKCEYTVWPGLLSNAGVAPLSNTGFSLEKGETQTINPPSNWGGRFWGRTLCSTDKSGKFSCQTGDCGSGKLECAGGGAAPPATLAEFTLDGSGGLDFYDVSLVDGYNLPMLVVPAGGKGDNCSSTGCVVDLNAACPSELKVESESGGQSVACKSACEAFDQPQYCCSGAYASPNTCKPSSYSEVFKKACPRAYSYAYDDKTSTFTCGGGATDYTITFCPSPSTSQKASDEGGQTTTDGSSSADSSEMPLINSPMVYEGALDVSSAAASTTASLLSSTCIHVLSMASAIAIVTAVPDLIRSLHN